MTPEQQEALILDNAKRSFHDYVCLMNDGYIASKFSRALCWIVQEAIQGKYRNKIVIVHAPPRSGKSQIISRSAAAWFTGHNPAKDVLMVGASEDLANDFTTHLRSKIQNPKHVAIFGDRATIGVRSRSSDFMLAGGGTILALGMNSGSVGKGSSLLLIDDPYSTFDMARTPSERERIWNKFNELSTRRNTGDFTTIIVAQRLHKDDLSGRLMRERPDQCVYFAFPFIIEDEADKRRDVLKRDIGEVLVPELFGIDSVASIKKTVDTWVWQAAYKGVPPGEEGTQFKAEWLKSIDIDPAWAADNMSLYLFGDPASAKTLSSDYSAFFVIGCAEDGNYYILDGLRERLNLQERWKKFRDMWKKWRPLATYYEQYGAASDLEYFQEQQQLEKCQFEIINSAYITHSSTKRKEGEKGEKEVRIEKLIPQMSAGKWYYAAGISRQRDRGDGTFDEYNAVEEMKRDEMPDWPTARNDDCLDAISRINDISPVWPIHDVRSTKTHKIRAVASPW